MTRLFTIVAALALLVGIACSSGDSGDAGSTANDAAEAPFEIDEEPVATNDVELPKSYKFEPAAITVGTGEDVTWTNNDDFPHNVHLLDGSDVTEDLPVGGTVTLSFDEAGEIYYECSIHPQQMQGKIVVE